jgi:hypothetical protein
MLTLEPELLKNRLAKESRRIAIETCSMTPTTPALDLTTDAIRY